MQLNFLPGFSGSSVRPGTPPSAQSVVTKFKAQSIFEIFRAVKWQLNFIAIIVLSCIS